MTTIAFKSKKKSFKAIVPNLICLFFALIMLIFSNDMKSGVLYGINLSINTIVPTLFPFFILSDLWSSQLSINKNSVIGSLFQRMFGINGIASSAFLCGTVCGFPLGAKSAVDYYNAGVINKKELERLCALSSNPSCAFVISGIGAGMYGDAKLGIILYFCVIFSSIFVGLITKDKGYEIAETGEISRQSFNLVDSIKNAGISSIAVSSYIIFFSALISLWRSLCQNEYFNLLFSSFAEVSSACCIIKDWQTTPTSFSLALTAFALGFSGLSVHLQAFSFLPSFVSKKKFILLKFMVGLLSFLLSFSIFSLIK